MNHVIYIGCATGFLKHDLFRLIRAVLSTGISFLSVAEQYSTAWIFHMEFIHSAAGRCVDCFQFEVIINDAAVNIHLQVFVRICLPFSWVDSLE